MRTEPFPGEDAFVARSSLLPSGGNAARWVAGTGAFLLVAAAALFVAVRWEDIPDAAKLAAVCVITGVCLVAGDRLRTTLPMSAGVVYHLGAFLIPVDVGAVGVHLGLGAYELVAVEGVAGAAAFWALSAAWRSTVLRWAAGVSVVVAALGLGAVTPVPATVILAVAAVAAVTIDARSPAAFGWALGAGFGSALAVAATAVLGRPDILTGLGIPAAAEPLPSVVAGVVSATVLGIGARTTLDRGRVFMAFGALASSLLVAWTGAELGRTWDVLALPAVFLAVELTALVVGRDAFWGLPATVVALGAEALAGLAVIPMGFYVLAAPITEEGLFGGGGFTPDAVLGGAFGLMAIAWTAAAVRRAGDRSIDIPQGPWVLGALPAGLAVIASALAGTASGVGAALAMVAAATAFASLRHRALDVAAVAACLYAPVSAWSHPVSALVIGLLGAAMLTAAARERDDDLLALGALGTLALGTFYGVDVVGVGWAGAVFATGAWGMALAYGRSRIATSPRIAMILVVVASIGWAPGDRLIALVPVTLFLAAEAVRAQDPRIAFGSALSVQLVVFDLAILAGLPIAEVGLVLSTSAVVWAGLALTVTGEWQLPLATAALAATGAGLVTASADPGIFGVALAIAGALAIGAAVVLRREPLAHLGSAAIIVGSWIEAAHHGVGAAEAYVVLPSVYLLAVGWWSRRERGMSSWVAYAPAVALAGGTAFAERIGTGEGWHAVLAGAIAVVAVAWGGWGRLAGPLFTGTALLVAVTVYESLAVVATVPTWAWLATGGKALLAAGVAMERSEVGPVEAGRRAAAAIGSRFE